MYTSTREVARAIDHSLLGPTMTVDELEQGCRLAVDYGVASVCIMPHYLKRCAELLSGSDVKASTTIGFPHGGHTTAIKRAEAQQALSDGCQELDMVVNVGRVLSDDWDYVTAEIKAVIQVTHDAGQRVKVIFENCYLEERHKIRLCEICSELDADWVKTSTGYGSQGATFADVQLMVENTPPQVEVKAAGGIRDLDTLLKFLELGATRVGASRTQQLLDEFKTRL